MMAYIINVPCDVILKNCNKGNYKLTNNAYSQSFDLKMNIVNVKTYCF